MIEVIGVRFRRAGKIYYFSPGDLRAAVGEHVVVETVRGTELGEVAVGPKMVSEQEITQPLKKVIRLATDRDLAQIHQNKDQEAEAFGFAQERIEALGLDMKLVAVEYTFDKSKLVFYFTADKRVDFRELVKELASHLRIRIELRQIGVRDEAKMLGGLGVCGQCLCCSTWIGDFEPVSIRYAKEQELSMNPGKISGLCGRLKCCLRYEAEAYSSAHARQPKIGDVVQTETSKARVVAVNLLRENATVQWPEGQRSVVNWDQIEGGCLAEGHFPVLDEKPFMKAEPQIKDPQPKPVTAKEGKSSSEKASGSKAKRSKRRRWRRRKKKRSTTAAGS